MTHDLREVTAELGMGGNILCRIPSLCYHQVNVNVLIIPCSMIKSHYLHFISQINADRAHFNEGN